MLTLESNADKIPLCDYCHGELFLDQKNEASKEKSENFIKFIDEFEKQEISFRDDESPNIKMNIPHKELSTFAVKSNINHVYKNIN